MASRLNWPCVRINLDSHISRIDLIGKDAVLNVTGPLAFSRILYQNLSEMIESDGDQDLSNSIAAADPENLDSMMDELIAIRRKLRDANSYDLADFIRDSLAKLNLIIEDSPKGSSWRWQ